MMAALMQLGFLSVLVSVTVCDAVYKLVNSSVQLDIKKYSPISSLYWTFNDTKNIVFEYKGDVTLHREYKDRVVFTKETHSLTLKNLQKNDSGIYKAEITAENREVLATFELYVLDSVEKPVLTADLQPYHDICNVSLICGVQKFSVTSNCYNNICNIKEQKMAVDAFFSLSLYVSNSLIICNYSNPVNWKNATMEMKYLKQLCSTEDESMHRYCMV